MADGATEWPGLPGGFTDSVTILLAPNGEIFDSLTGGSLPEWGTAAAFPERMTVVLQADEGPTTVLRHELAHLALHASVPHTPVWFQEGYAVWAAGEWNRFESLRINLALVLGRVPSLRDLSRQLREGRSRAGAAYALAGTVVAKLDGIAGEEGLVRLVSAYRESGDLDGALRSTYLITLDQFEESWQKEIKRRYGWLSLVTSFTVFWLFVGILLGALWWRRRRGYGSRKADLDIGWDIPEEDWRGS
jgi:hypothetical protein